MDEGGILTDEMSPFEIQCKSLGWATICRWMDAASAISNAMQLKQQFGDEYRVKEDKILVFSTEGLPIYSNPQFDFDWLTEGF